MDRVGNVVGSHIVVVTTVSSSIFLLDLGTEKEPNIVDRI